MNRDLWLILFGSFLAFAGGLTAFFIQWWWTRNNQKKIVKEFLRELFNVFTRSSQRIIETYERSNILWIDLLNQVSNDLMLYERNKEHIILIKSSSIRRNVWDWFSNTRTVINMCLGINSILISNPQNPYNPEHPQYQWALEEAKKQISKIKELKIEAQRLIEILDKS